MPECVAYDDDGSIMQQYTINTICPIRHAAEARKISLMHVVEVELCTGEVLGSMLPDLLYDKKTNVVTHISCSRNGYDNMVRKQISTMTACNLSGDNWVSDTYYYIEDNPDINIIKSKFCFVLGDRQKFLDYLGLAQR